MILGLVSLAVFLGTIVVLLSTLPTLKNEPSFPVGLLALNQLWGKEPSFVFHGPFEVRLWDQENQTPFEVN
jgi:hypothetical protein